MTLMVQGGSSVTTDVPAIPGIPDATLTAAKAGDAVATLAVLQSAEADADDAAFFIDGVAVVGDSIMVMIFAAYLLGARAGSR